MPSENPSARQDENENISGRTDPLLSTAYTTTSEASRVSERLKRGDIIGRAYKVLEFLGSGGMSDVYMCEDLSIGRTIAVKTLKSGYSEDSLRRFQTEGKAIAKLEDPNIVKLYGLTTTEDGMPILLMEYVPGKTLAQLLEPGQALPLQRALKIASQITEALKSAEKQGIIHRDLKPSNIMVVNPGSLDEKVKILDFGIAKIQGEPSINATQTGEVFGTPKYMSPEQALGKKCDGRADQYAFGCILFEMLTGKAPFNADNAFSLMMAHVQDRSPSLSKTAKQPIPEHLDAVVNKLLQKDPTDRFGSMDELCKAVFASRSQKNVFGKFLIAAFATCLVLIIAAVAFVFQDNSKSTRKYDQVSETTTIQKAPSTPPAVSLQPLVPSEGDEQLLNEVNELKNARSLDLGKKNITDFGLETVAKAKHLRILNLLGNRHITSKGVQKLASLPLQSLNLDGTGIDDEASKSIAQMSTLKDLELNNTDITDETCKNISVLPTLKRLWIADTSIDGRSLPYLSKLTTLKYLDLSNDDVAENLEELHALTLDELSLKKLPNAKHTARERLMSLKSLKSLDLSDTSIDDSDLLRLVEMPNLETIYINGCNGISTSAIKEVLSRRALPKIISDRRAAALSANSAKFRAKGEELVRNGDFEATKIGEQCVVCKAGEPTLKDWAVLYGSVDLVGGFNSSSGKNLVDLNGYQAQGAITQSVDTTIGDEYLLQFDATTHPDQTDVSKSFTVKIGDQSKTFSIRALYNTRLQMHWKHFEWPFKAKSARTQITFESSNDTDQGACIDTISVRRLLTN